MDGEAARLARGATIARGAMRFLGLLALGMPLAVVALYYAVGWKAAVLAFPLLLVGLLRLLSSTKQDDPASRARRPRRVLGLASISIVPITAVMWDEPEIMRIWAYATALPFSVGLALDGKRKIDRSATTAAGIIFVAASEVIWLFGSIAGWIWFHAFAVPIFLFGFAFLVHVFSPRDKDKEIRNTRELEPPPRGDGDVSTAALQCVIVTRDRERRVFKSVSRSQAQGIYEADWRGEYDHLLKLDMIDEALPRPTFYVAFNGNGVLKFEADGPSTITVQWIYMEVPERRRLLGRPVLVGGSKVPYELGPEIIADVWNDDVEALNARLQPHAGAPA